MGHLHPQIWCRSEATHRFSGDDSAAASVAELYYYFKNFQENALRINKYNISTHQLSIMEGKSTHTNM